MGSNKVRHAILMAPRTIEIVQRQRPPLKPGQVRIAVEQCGISWSDVKVWAGETQAQLPAELGRELAGEVIERSQGVKNVGVGDRVVAWAPAAGGLAAEAVVDARHCFKVGTKVRFPFVAEPLARVFNSALKAGAFDKHTVVVGPGFLGMLMVMVLGKKAPSLTVASHQPGALYLAGQVGATHVAVPGALEEVVQGVTKGRGADVACEFTGGQAGLDLAAQVVRPGGKLVVGGFHQGLAASQSRIVLREGQRVLDLERLARLGVELVNAHTHDAGLVKSGMKHAQSFLEQRLVDWAAVAGRTESSVDLAAPLGRVVNTIERAAMGPGANTVVIGSSARALFAVMLTRAERAPRTLILVTRQAELGKLARSLGATHVVDPANLGAAVAEVTEGEGADVVYEFTGVQEGLDLATRAVCVSGKLVIGSLHSGLPTPDGRWELKPGQRVLDLERLNAMAVDLVNGHFLDREVIRRGMASAVSLLRDGGVDPAPLIGRDFPLEQTAAAFEEAARGPGKVFVKP